ncbi:MAG: hypothetical protein ACKO7D_09920 [Bacteroidota bacterium]
MIDYRLFFLAIVSTILCSSCMNDPLDVDSSDIKISLNFINADSMLYQSTDSRRILLNRNFKQSFPDLYLFTFEKGLKIRTSVDSTYANQLATFYKDQYVKELEKEIEISFKLLSPEKKEMVDAMKYLRYHFPKMKTPKNIVFFNSLFSYNTLATNTDIGIGLEWYLGSENKLIKKSSIQGLYDYMKTGMDRKYLVRDVVYQWVYAQVQAPTDAKFAEDMVSWGKLLYCIEAALPDKEKSIILRYSSEKFKWAEENEKRIWKYFVEQKLLFKNDELLKLGYFNEAPYTKGLPKESPDRLGQYIGWKMVRKYMDENPDLALEKLVKVPFAQIMQAYKID